jgi:hypothetical protein
MCERRISMTKQNCHQCRFFYITWDQKTPYGCKLYQIQSTQMPSQIVKSAGSGDCQGFTPKDLKSGASKSVSEPSKGY